MLVQILYNYNEGGNNYKKSCLYTVCHDRLNLSTVVAPLGKRNVITFPLRTVQHAALFSLSIVRRDVNFYSYSHFIHSINQPIIHIHQNYIAPAIVVS